MSETGLLTGDDGVTRCWWPGRDEQYLRYHDEEWGQPVGDDFLLFERVALESFQSGLSWLTILRKRENFRKAFVGFDFEKVATFGEADVARLLGNEGIIRHRGKIEATINNAQRAIELIAEVGSLSDYFERYRPQNRPVEITLEWVKANPTCPEAVALSKDLKKRGWKFVGPTTAYSLMQAVGLVNDHLSGCAHR